LARPGCGQTKVRPTSSTTGQQPYLPLAWRKIEELQLDAAIEKFVELHCGKFSRIFRARCGYFPKKIRLPRAQNGKNAMKLRLYMM
jgi:hypothetical protein